MMRLQIGKWGNSLAVRLPAALLQKLFLKEGDTLEATIEPDGTLHLFPTHGFNKKGFLTKLNKLNHSLPSTKSVIETMRREERY
jgi:antitoxin MazE